MRFSRGYIALNISTNFIGSFSAIFNMSSTVCTSFVSFPTEEEDEEEDEREREGEGEG